MKRHTLFPFLRWRMCDRLLAMSLAATLSLAGCTGDDRMAGDSLPEGKYPMTFSTAVEGLSVTRATTDNTWTGNEVVAVQVGGVTKKYKPASGGASTTLQAADNEKPFYWQKSDETKEVSAWYLGTGYQEKLPTTWTVQSDQSTAGYQASDMLYASQTFTFSKTASSQLVFKHLPAKVVINLKAGDGLAADEVTNAIVTLVNQALTSGKIDENGSVEKTATGDKEITPNAVQSVSNGYQRTLQALLVPQQMQNIKFIKVTIGASVYYYTPTCADDADLATGKQYTYNITVKKDELEVTAPPSVSWKDDVTTDDAQETKDQNPFVSSADISSSTTNITEFKGYAVCQSMNLQSGFSTDTHWACYSALHDTRPILTF